MQRYFFIAICAFLVACNPYHRDIERGKQLVEQAERIELSAPSAAYLLLDSVKYPALLPDDWLVRYCQVACRLADSIHTPLPFLYDLDFALYHAKQKKDPELQAQMGFYLGRSLQQEGLSRQALQTFTEAEARSQAAGDSLLSARILLEMGRLYEAKGDYPQIYGRYRQALRRFQQANDVPRQAETWYLLGKIYAAQDSFPLASACIRRADSLAWRAGDTAAIVSLYNKVGEMYQTAKRWPEAKQAFRRAISLAPPSETAPAFLALGTIYLQEDSLLQAEHCLREARKSPMPTKMYADWLRQFGELEGKRGHYHSGIDTLRKCEKEYDMYTSQWKMQERAKEKQAKEYNLVLEDYNHYLRRSLYIKYGIITFLVICIVLLLFLLRYLKKQWYIMEIKKYILDLQGVLLNQKEQLMMYRQMKELSYKQRNELVLKRQQKREEKAQYTMLLDYKEKEWQRQCAEWEAIGMGHIPLELIRDEVPLLKKLYANNIKIRDSDLKIIALENKMNQIDIHNTDLRMKIIRIEMDQILIKISMANRLILEKSSLYKDILTWSVTYKDGRPLSKRKRKAVGKLLDSLYPNMPELLDKADFTPTERLSCYLSFFELPPKEEAILLGISPDEVDEIRTNIRRKLSLKNQENRILFYFLERIQLVKPKLFWVN